MKININNIMDDLEGKWWNHISVAKFGFLERISSNLNDFSVDVDDILIHKEIKSGESFPTNAKWILHKSN